MVFIAVIAASSNLDALLKWCPQKTPSQDALLFHHTPARTCAMFTSAIFPNADRILYLDFVLQMPFQFSQKTNYYSLTHIVWEKICACCTSSSNRMSHVFLRYVKIDSLSFNPRWRSQTVSELLDLTSIYQILPSILGYFYHTVVLDYIYLLTNLQCMMQPFQNMPKYFVCLGKLRKDLTTRTYCVKVFSKLGKSSFNLL